MLLNPQRGVEQHMSPANDPSESSSLDIEEFAQLLRHARRAVVFTGAGISTESGISDFRSAGGIWSKMSPIYYQDFVASEQSRRESWRRKIETDREMLGAKPNRGHEIVASLAHTGRVSSVITHNIDGLHQASGVPHERVIELHGNATLRTLLGLSCTL
jgi:NAD-dependent deacetylase